MEHFVKMVNKLLNKHTPFKTFNKEPNMCSSKPWRATDITKSIKVRDNYIKSSSTKKIRKGSRETKPIHDLLELYSHSSYMHRRFILQRIF